MPRKRNLNYSIYRRKDSPFWWGQFQTKSGTVPFSTKLEATDENKDLATEKVRREYYKHLKADIGIFEKERLTLNEAFGTYLDYEKNKLSVGWLKTVNSAMDSFLDYFKPHTYFDEISTAGMASFLNNKKLSNASKNRYLAVFRRVVNFLDNFDQSIPNIKFKTLKHQEPDSRMNEISKEDFNKFYNKLPEHLKPIVLFALLTGLRKSNVLNLNWKQIDLFKGVITVPVKSKKPGGKILTVPISNAVKQLLLQLEPKKEGYVFLYQGKPLTDIKRAFKAARYDTVIINKKGKVKRICWLPNFRFHDLRHTFACWCLNEGMDIKTLQDLLSHEDIRTTLKYARKQKEKLKDALDNMVAFSQFNYEKQGAK